MKRRIAPKILTVYFLFFILVVALLGVFWSKNRKPPQQPIAFSHQIHVQKVGLKCAFCHDKVEKSTFAGIPSVQKCMSCHKSVKTESPEIKKLTNYWNEKLPIPWLRVYRTPVRNYVHFSHKRHIKAGLECATCHGEVQVMITAKKVRKLEMGWCVSCHRVKKAPTDCTTCHK